MSSTGDRFARIKALLLEALDMEPDLREAWVRENAGDDGQLADEVLSLLAQQDSAAAILDRGVVPAQEVPERIGRYFIEEVLGEGGMGIVYRARQEEPIRRQVALKLIRRGMDHESVVRRFDHERRTLARMDHPHIATVLDAGTDQQGRPWFVMPLVKGLPLLDYCDQHRLAIADRLQLFEDICRAVHHAHGRGVLHRDLKPGNILVREVGGQATPVIIDFGIAKALTPEAQTNTMLTREGQQVGTPAYMSPEQLAGEEDRIDVRSDVFSLGVILYELMVGRHPWPEAREKQSAATGVAPALPSTVVSGDNTGELAARRGMRTGELRRHLKGDIDTICLMALRAEPERRYPSAAHLADDLQRFREGHPVSARPDSWSYRTRKWISRHPAASTFIFAGLIALVSGGAGLTWHARQLASERDRALAAEQRARAELETSVAIGDFMESLFTLARPDQGGSTELRAIDMIDQGRTRVGTELAGQPWLQARLYRILGVVNLSLSRLDQADTLLTRALAMNDSIRGKSRGDILLQRANILLELGVLQHDLGDYETAEATQREALADFSASGQTDSTDIAFVLNLIGIDLQAQGRLEDSLAPTERGLRLSEEYGEPDNPEIPWGWGSLGYINFQLGRFDVATEEFEHALELARKIFEGDHYDLAHHLNNLAGMYQRLGRVAEAESLFVENLEMNQRMFRDEPNGSLGRAYYNLAGLHLDLDQPQRALDLLEPGYDAWIESLGPEHPRTAMHLGRLALARQLCGQTEQALADGLRAWEILDSTLPEGHRRRGSARLTLARLYILRGEFDQALPLLEQSLNDLDDGRQATEIPRAGVLEYLGQAHAGLGRTQEARQDFKAAIRLYSKTFDPGHFKIERTRRLLGELPAPKTREAP